MYSYDKKPPVQLKESKQTSRPTVQMRGGADLAGLSSAIGNQAMLSMLGMSSRRETPSPAVSQQGPSLADYMREKFALRSGDQHEAAPSASASRGGSSLPDYLREKFERKSGVPMDDVRVHYNSDKPAELDAAAYTYGPDVFIGPKQEDSLEHELTHVVQQKQGIVRPTGYRDGFPVNESSALEGAADRQSGLASMQGADHAPAAVMQFMKKSKQGKEKEVTNGGSAPGLTNVGVTSTPCLRPQTDDKGMRDTVKAHDGVPSDESIKALNKLSHLQKEKIEYKGLDEKNYKMSLRKGICSFPWEANASSTGNTADGTKSPTSLIFPSPGKFFEDNAETLRHAIDIIGMIARSDTENIQHLYNIAEKSKTDPNKFSELITFCKPRPTEVLASALPTAVAKTTTETSTPSERKEMNAETQTPSETPKTSPTDYMPSGYDDYPACAKDRMVHVNIFSTQYLNDQGKIDDNKLLSTIIHEIVHLSARTITGKNSDTGEDMKLQGFQNHANLFGGTVLDSPDEAMTDWIAYQAYVYAIAKAERDRSVYGYYDSGYWSSSTMDYIPLNGKNLNATDKEKYNIYNKIYNKVRINTIPSAWTGDLVQIMADSLQSGDAVSRIEKLKEWYFTGEPSEDENVIKDQSEKIKERWIERKSQVSSGYLAKNAEIKGLIDTMNRLKPDPDMKKSKNISLQGSSAPSAPPSPSAPPHLPTFLTSLLLKNKK